MKSRSEGKHRASQQRVWVAGTVSLLVLGVITSLVMVRVLSVGADSTLPDSVVVVAGSTTLHDLTASQMNLFVETRPEVGITLDSAGTGDGLRKLCLGEVAVANASRPIGPRERNACVQEGVELVEVVRALDGVVLIVANANSLTCVSLTEVQQIVAQATYPAHSARARNSLGQTGGEVTAVAGPERSSGTFGAMVELGLRPAGVDVGPDYLDFSDNDDLIAAVSTGRGVLGWTSLAVAEEAEAAGLVRSVEVQDEESGECIPADRTTIASHEFPLTRTLSSYVNLETARSNAGLRRLVELMLSDKGNALVEGSGLVRLSALERQRVLDNWRIGLAG